MKKYIIALIFICFLFLIAACDSEAYYVIKYYDGDLCVNQCAANEGKLLDYFYYNKHGFVLEGWYDDSGKRWDYDSDKVKSNMSLYARFTPQSFNVTIHVSEDIHYSYAAVYNQSINIPIKEGHTFSGWYFDSGYTEEFDFNKIHDDAHIYAKWTANTYKLTLVYNNLMPNTISDIVFDAVLDIQTPINEEKIFAGWYLDEQFSVEFEYEKMPAGNLTLYAKWIDSTQSNEIYNIYFELNHGIGTTHITVKANNKIQYPESPERENYKFLGWYKDADFKELNDYEYMPEHDIWLYAKWELRKYIITFDSAGGSTVADITAYYLDVIQKPSNPIKAGYEFCGWFSDVKLTQAFIFSQMPAYDIILYAKWNIKSYKISFETFCEYVIEDIDVTFNDKIVLPDELERTGYDFAYWCTDERLFNKLDFDVMPAESFKLYAKWNVKKYKITFISNYSFEADYIELEYNAKIILPQPPSIPRYTFIEWLDENGLPFILAQMPAQNLTLIALWRQNEFAVHYYDGNELLYTSETAYGAKPVLPYMLYKDDSVFGGWYSDKKCTTVFNETEPITSDTNVYLKWLDAADLFIIDQYQSGCKVSKKQVAALPDTLVFPKVIGGKAVMQIGDFSLCGFEYVVIPETVQVIGDEAFSDCKSLTGVEILDGTRIIGKLAFYNCVALESISFPKTVEIIEDGAFWYCKSLDNIVFPHSLLQLNQFAFAECIALKRLTFLSSVPPQISNSAFNTGSNAVISIYVPSNATETYRSVFDMKHFDVFSIKTQ